MGNAMVLSVDVDYEGKKNITKGRIRIESDEFVFSRCVQMGSCLKTMSISTLHAALLDSLASNARIQYVIHLSCRWPCCSFVEFFSEGY